VSPFDNLPELLKFHGKPLIIRVVPGTFGTPEPVPVKKGVARVM
jgi:hypothetical protein